MDLARRGEAGDFSFFDLGVSGLHVLSDDVDDSMALGFGAGLELPVGERVGFTLEGLFT